MPPPSAETALTELVHALESSHAALRGVATRLEAEFDRVYCSSRGAASAAVNPARLAARLAALNAAIPAAADAALAIAHSRLEQARAVRADSLAARAAARRIVAAVRAGAILDRESSDDEADDGRAADDARDRAADEELETLCERLGALVSCSQKAHRALVVAQTPADALLSNDDLNLALLKAGLSSADSSPMDLSMQSPACQKPAGKTRTTKNADNSRDDVRDGSSAIRSTLAWATSSAKSRPVGGKKGVSTVDKENTCAGTQQVQQKTPNQRPASGRKAPLVVPTEFIPIDKAAYQRLPRTLRLHAKLESLNETYAKTFAALSKANGPMPQSQLLAATGEETIDTIDVLRRGFSVVKNSSAGWMLGPAPAKA
jgi:hypothetical protein